MRKLLLASAAILGGTTGAWAQAESVPMFQSQGMIAMPWMGGPAANNNNNVWGKAIKGSVAVPTPGTVVIRLNGRVESDIHASFTSGDRFTSTTSGVTTNFKVNPIGFSSYMRLYPGIDGLATNGLRYGASIELRQNFPSPTNQTTFTTATNPSSYSSGETVLVRRAFVYLGTDQVGIVRIGQTDGVIGLFDNGTYTSQTWDGGIGNFNGGGIQPVAPGSGTAIPFAWLSQAGTEYSNSKIVYLTPQFAGFDFGVQYAPTQGNSYSNSTGASALQATQCNAAGVTCNNLSAGTDATRWINQVAAGVRYQRSFPGVNVGAFAVYETAGKESIAGGGAVPTTGGNVGTFKYDNLSFVNAAMFVQVPSVGVTWALAYNGGAVNGQLAMRPTGGAPENAFLTGLVYRNGPWTLGAEVGIVESQGDARLTKVSQRKETEIAFGGSYAVAPGLTMALEFMHTERHQGGFDFVGGGLGTQRNDVKGNGVTFSTSVAW